MKEGKCATSIAFLGSNMTVLWLLFVVLQYLVITFAKCSGVTIGTKLDPVCLPQNYKQSMNYSAPSLFV
jgi:hypothetical protein